MRTKRSEKYNAERDSICIQLIRLLELDDTHGFILADLDNDVEKQNKIIEMKTDIQKVFECSNISAFKPNFECKRPYLSIVRSILRKHGYSFIGNDHWIKDENGAAKKTVKYFIFKNN
jgi:hypothetical protein